MLKAEAARKTGQALVVSLVPDICLTQAGTAKIPVPYPVVARFEDSTATSTDVLFGGDPAFMLDQSTISKVTGDEASTDGGIKSGTKKSIVEPVLGSTTVKCNGKQVVRHGDFCTMNNGNTIGMVIYQVLECPSVGGGTDLFVQDAEAQIGQCAPFTGVNGAKVTGVPKAPVTLAVARKNKISPAAKAAKKETGKAANEKNCQGDPVNCVTGEVVCRQTDFTLPGRVPLAWTRSYGSQTPRKGVCGHGWQTPADARLVMDANGLVIFYDGLSPGRVFERLPDTRAELEVAGGAELCRQGDDLHLTLKSGYTYIFCVPGNPAGEVVVDRITDDFGNALYFEREADGLAAIKDTSGRVIRVESRDGCIQRMELHVPDAPPRVLVTYGYSVEEDLSAVYNPLNKAHRYQYDSHRLVKQTYRSGLSFCYTYDGDACIRSYGDNGLFDYRFAYEKGRTTVTNSLGFHKIFVYDESCLLTQITDHRGHSVLYSHDEAGRTETITDPLGHSVSYVYDSRGNPHIITGPDGAAVSFIYDEHNRVAEVIDPNGGSWRQQWDENGRLVKQTSACNAVVSYAYDERGDLISVTDARGNVTGLACDVFGNTVKITDAGGSWVGFCYDALGKLTEAFSVQGDKTVYTYNANGLLTQVETGTGQKNSWAYDDHDRLVSHTDAAGNTTGYTYTGMDELAGRINPDATSVRYTYDSEDQLIGVTDELGRHYTLVRDDAGRVVSETDYWGRTRTYSYDAAGRLVQCEDPMGRRMTCAYDPAGRLVEKLFDNGGAESFDYDTAGNLVHFANDDTAVNRVYDKANRLIKEIMGDVRVVNGYDVSGRRIKRRSSHGNRVRYHYGVLGSVMGVTLNGRAVLDMRAGDDARSLVEQLAGGLARTCRFDRHGRLRQQQVRSKNQVLIDRNYGYDAANNLTARHDRFKGTDYFTYNPAGNIIKHIDPRQREHLCPRDPAGNPAGTDLWPQTAWDARAAAYGDAQYRYYPDGSLMTRTDETGQNDAYIWDHNQRLVATTGSRGIEAGFVYDALGRRTAKTVNSATTAFGWDGEALLSDSSTAHGVREFVYYPDSFEPLAMVNGNKEVFVFHNDPNGAPLELTDPSGQIVWSASYTTHGGIDRLDVKIIDNPLRLQGQYADEELRLHYNRHRYYDPGIGLFISQDPLRLAAGTNLYRFAPNVWAWIDPMGLACDKIDNKNVFFGHGAWTHTDGEIVVPEGTTITFFVDHGALMWEGYAYDAVVIGEVDIVKYAKDAYRAMSCLPNEIIFNYTLIPPLWLKRIGPYTEVKRPTHLNNLLRPNMGHILWCACRDVPLGERLAKHWHYMNEDFGISPREMSDDMMNKNGLPVMFR